MLEMCSKSSEQSKESAGKAQELFDAAAALFVKGYKQLAYPWALVRQAEAAISLSRIMRRHCGTGLL